MHKLGFKDPTVKFMNEIHWGTGPGSIRVLFGTGLNIMLEKQTTDLIGTPRWITKKVYQLDQSGYGGHEDAIAHELLEQLEKIDQMPPDSPQHDYQELENLVCNIAGSMRRTARSIFIFEGIKKLADNEYVIRMGVRAHGLELWDQRRVIENQTNVTYNPETGVIRMTNYNVASKTKGHEWRMTPSDTNWYFCPTQSREEITETICNAMHWY
jgi:hypothetical protein